MRRACAEVIMRSTRTLCRRCAGMPDVRSTARASHTMSNTIRGMSAGGACRNASTLCMSASVCHASRESVKVARMLVMSCPSVGSTLCAHGMSLHHANDHVSHSGNVSGAVAESLYGVRLCAHYRTALCSIYFMHHTS